MPETMTDAEVVEILATRGMGWKKDYALRDPNDHKFGLVWRTDPGSWIDSREWNPLADLNTIYKVEERLTEEQQKAYLKALAYGHSYQSLSWFLRHADARTCAYALAQALKERTDAR